MSGPKVVALGGGHGLAASLAALRHVCDDLTAIVTVADNGGSSGRLREEFGLIPPGDLRMALAALCADDEWGQTWAQVLQHRFDSSGELDGHAVGNLLITALWDLFGDPVAGLDWVGRLLGSRGRVLPMSTQPLDITAEVRGADRRFPDAISVVRGQAQVATTCGVVERVDLEPADPPACPEAISAIAQADWVVLGPGSWYTSVIPHLMVPGIREALQHTEAKIWVNLNLVPQEGETDGLTPADHLQVLLAHAPTLRLDRVLADPSSCGGESHREELARTTAEFGGELLLEPLRETPESAQHDSEKLQAAYASQMRSA